MTISKGNRVRFTDRVYLSKFRGLTGTVRWVIETRGIAIVLCDNGQRYDVFVEDLELVKEEG